MKMLAITAFAAAAFAVPASAQTVDHRFEYDGVTYDYTSETHGDTTVLSGRAYPGTRFRLRIRDGRVVGHAGPTRISFTVAEAREQFGAMQVASASD